MNPIENLLGLSPKVLEVANPVDCFSHVTTKADSVDRDVIAILFG